MSLSLRCVSFSRVTFWEEFRKAARLSDQKTETDQFNYLASYLAHDDIKTSTIVVENPYVDRHYLEEFTGYYATILHAPPPQTTRLHFFSLKMSTEEFLGLVEEAVDNYEEGADARKAYNEVQDRLQKAYLGFIVIRPLPSAPVGRTILKTYPREAGKRRFYGPAAPAHHAHLAGIELSVNGVPFQQQDQAVGACATTALWSALARVTRIDGKRAITPFAVTKAANRYRINDRIFPAVSGLDLRQMLTAIQEFGYSPLALSTSREPELFKFFLKCYLASGIPVILRVGDGQESHAITAIGFREADESEGKEPIQITQGGYTLQTLGMSRLYAHDDRLGPYARFRWETELSATEQPQIRFYSYAASGFEKFKEPLVVQHAIVPLYHKLRLAADSLISLAGAFLSLVKKLVDSELHNEIYVSVRFSLGGRYFKEIISEPFLEATRLSALVSTVMLSRYVGLIRFSVGSEFCAEVICDTTDIQREYPPFSSVLAFIPADTTKIPVFKSYLQSLNPQITIV